MPEQQANENEADLIEGIVVKGFSTVTPLDNVPHLFFKLKGDGRQYVFRHVSARVDVGERVRLTPCSGPCPDVDYVSIIEVLDAEGKEKFRYGNDAREYFSFSKR